MLPGVAAIFDPILLLFGVWIYDLAFFFQHPLLPNDIHPCLICHLYSEHDGGVVFHVTFISE